MPALRRFDPQLRGLIPLRRIFLSGYVVSSRYTGVCLRRIGGLFAGGVGEFRRGGVL